MNNYEDQERETTLQGEAEDLAQVCEESEQIAAAPVEWHSVVYPASEGFAEPPKHRVNKKRFATAALAIACALAIALVAGVGGAFLAKQMLLSADHTENGALIGDGDVVFGENGGNEGNNENGGNESNNQNNETQGNGAANGTGGSGTEIGDGTPYPADTDPYDYLAAVSALQKNNNAALVGSVNGSAGDAGRSEAHV